MRLAKATAAAPGRLESGAEAEKPAAAEAGRAEVYAVRLIRQVRSPPSGLNDSTVYPGITDNLPMSRNRSWGIKAKGGDYDGGKFQGVFVYIVSPGYLKTMGMRLMEGREINWADLQITGM